MNDSSNDGKAGGGLSRVGDLLPAIVEKVKPLSPVAQRLVTMPVQDPNDVDILFQHSVLYQTCMPYRDPGDEVRAWQRKNGGIHLLIKAREAWTPCRGSSLMWVCPLDQAPVGSLSPQRRSAEAPVARNRVGR
jgi:hypothetical protein